LKKTFLILAFAIGLFFCSESLYAVGVGFYGNFYSGLTFGKYNNSHWAIGGGLVVDSNLAKDSLFNYRLELGCDWFNMSWYPGPTAAYYTDACSKLSSTHYFGFGIVRTQNIRFWIGPQIEISGIFGQYHNGMFGGVGLALGTNFNVNDQITFSMVISLRAVGAMIYGTYQVISSSGALESNSKSFGFYGGSGKISLACIFRINDTFSPVTKDKGSTDINLRKL
jgi:hypothetical protein